ncbi:MAG: Fe-S cluster assembly ATPase SufC [Bacilli bacterium]|nr:Fe-S cluster assembly ATPase SufC [Bacilli bacterium]
MHILEMINLCVNINNKEILKNFNLIIKSGEIHTIMGPNGVGKSTLSKVIMGDENYKIISGEILFDGKDISSLKTDERANLGIFLGMQNPLEIDGVTNADFLRTALHSKMGADFKLMPFIKELNEITEQLKINKEMIHRSVNRGFSGGEKKKNEVLQMYILKPNTVLLDEIDSGLDVDALKIVGESVMDYYKKYNPAILLITHYERLLDYIKPNYVHILIDGHIVKSGDLSLVKLIEEKGYDYFRNSNESMTSEVV